MQWPQCGKNLTLRLVLSDVIHALPDALKCVALWTQRCFIPKLGSTSLTTYLPKRLLTEESQNERQVTLCSALCCPFECVQMTGRSILGTVQGGNNSDLASVYLPPQCGWISGVVAVFGYPHAAD